MSRPAVPADIMRRLRREVNLGCPEDDCGSPYLTYHHFDPPWEPEHRHDEAGMIALCHTHHTQADGGTWTPDQLREKKAQPFLAGAAVKDRLNWLRMHTIVAGGGGYCYGAETFVEAAGQQIVWFTRDSEGRMLLNVDLRDAAGSPLFTMMDNDWIVAGDVDDLEVPPKGRSLACKAAHDGVNLTLSMQEVSEEALQGLVREHSRAFDDDWTAVKQVVRTFPALLITLKAKLVWPVSVSITGSKIKVGSVSLPAPWTIGSPVAFSC